GPAATAGDRTPARRSDAGSRRAGAHESATPRPVYGRCWRVPAQAASASPDPPARLRVATTRAPPAGANETELRVALSPPDAAGLKSNSRRTTWITRFISSCAKNHATQRRTPPPNGIQVYVPAAL